MSKIINVVDCDIIYLSYDEPNAEKNYTDLCRKIPWAKRVHRVEGSDAAHKACAELSETSRFITVDGDNIVHSEFVNQSVEFANGTNLSNKVISWAGYNTINGLTYGNGGIKCWDKNTVLKMKTHENADKNNLKAQVDFCWDLDYVQLSKCMSTVENNYTPQQAWRAGFREGVKMCLIEGIKPSIKDMKAIHWKNLSRLYVWCMTGADVKNGLWAIYGAREGFYKTMCTDWDYINVRDFKWLNNYWNEKGNIVEEDIKHYIEELGTDLKNQLDVPIDSMPYNSGQSKFFKHMYKSPARPVHKSIVESISNTYDIIMISYGEQNSNENFNLLKRRFPAAKRIHGVKGIANAHIAAAEICDTDMMWIIDGDAEVVETFNFEYTVPEHDKDAVHVWRSKNPINDLEYGYGGIKLLPTELTKKVDKTRVDVNTSISQNFKVMKDLSCYTKFNTGPYESWKSAFRECAKLSSKIINRQKNDETNQRLEIWCTVGSDRPFGEYAIAGAVAGKEFGQSHKDKMFHINDFDWLIQQFKQAYNNIETEIIVDDIQEVYADNNPTRNTSVATNFKINNKKDNVIIDILDRFELLYGNKLSDVRRLYNDHDLTSIFKLTDNEDLRKAVVEGNIHSLFRIIDADEDLRKAVLEGNLNSLFRIIDADEDLRKAVVEHNLHSIFRLTDADEDLRKAVVEHNLHSIFRLTDADEDLRKAILEQNFYSMARLLPEVADEFKILDNDYFALWRILEKYSNSLLVNPIKKLYNNKDFDFDCISRGQIQSKQWLVNELVTVNQNLGTVFLCAGWYATVVPLLIEADVQFDKIRSFDIDPTVWKIAEIFNKSLVQDKWKFKASTADILELNYSSATYQTIKSNGELEFLKDIPNTIINTSCEHIHHFNHWYSLIPAGKLVILQTNNYFDIEEHVNCSIDLDNFVESAPMSQLLYKGKLELEKYDRFMIIGYK